MTESTKKSLINTIVQAIVTVLAILGFTNCVGMI
jgi:hypothetical protein